MRLSGRQRQRIGIAQAVQHNPQVLILDEDMSALDNLTEQAMLKSLRNLGYEITIMLIAHRLSTLKACDTIFRAESAVHISQTDAGQRAVSGEDGGLLLIVFA